MTHAGFTALSNDLIDSAAFAALTTGADVKVLVWFWKLARYEKATRRRRPGQGAKAGTVANVANNGQLVFTYKQAASHGLSSYQFSKALKTLFRLGFVDVAHLGRGVQGDHTRFSLSTRWMSYGAPGFVELQFPSNFKDGYRSGEHKKTRRLLRLIERNVIKLPLPT